MKTDKLITRAASGKRLTSEEGLALLKHADLLTLGELANNTRKRLHPKRVVTFIVDRNINYTNICVNKCKFCAFYRDAGSPEAYLLSSGEIFRKIEETLAQGGTQILMQGGVHPDLGIEYFEDLFSSIKSRYTIQIHSLSPAEVSFIAQHAKITIKETLTRLRAAGLDSIPGGGAEILVDRVRKKVSPNKIRWRQWAEVVWKEERVPHFIGDMPHTWVGSDFIRSALDFFAYEDGGALVLAAGVAPEWARRGVRVRGLSTHFGLLDYSIENNRMRIGGNVRVPENGIVVRSPFGGPDVIVRRLPADIVLKEGS